MAALSPLDPTRPMDPFRWWRRSAARNFLERNWLPRSLCTMQPATLPRRATAMLSASTAILDFIRSLME